MGPDPGLNKTMLNSSCCYCCYTQSRQNPLGPELCSPCAQGHFSNVTDLRQDRKSKNSPEIIDTRNRSESELTLKTAAPRLTAGTLLKCESRQLFRWYISSYIYFYLDMTPNHYRCAPGLGPGSTSLHHLPPSLGYIFCVFKVQFYCPALLLLQSKFCTLSPLPLPLFRSFYSFYFFF